VDRRRTTKSQKKEREIMVEVEVAVEVEVEAAPLFIEQNALKPPTMSAAPPMSPSVNSKQ